MSKISSEYFASFDCFDKSLILLSVISGSISILTFATVIGAPVGIASASFSFAFSITTGILKKYWKQQEIKTKSMINKIAILGRSKLDRIESTISKTTIDNEISYEQSTSSLQFLLTGDKFMSEMYLRQLASLNESGFTHSAWGPFTKNK